LEEKNSKRRPLIQNLMIYIAPVVRKVIGVQYVLRKEKKMAQVEVVEADQYYIVTNFIQTITPEILNQFQRSK